MDIHKSIIEKCKKGNRKAQYELYKLYSRAMFNICFRMMNSYEEAEDVLQESFTLAFKRLESFRYESTFGAWLKQIVVNSCINKHKKKKAELVFWDDLSNFDYTEEEKEDKEEIKLSVESIKKAMEKLPDGSRIVFSLYLIEGYDHKEIAQIMKISESTSKSQFLRAKRKVRELISTEQINN